MPILLNEALTVLLLNSPALCLASLVLFLRARIEEQLPIGLDGSDEVAVLLWALCWTFFGTSYFVVPFGQPGLLPILVFEWLHGLLPLGLILISIALGRTIQRRRGLTPCGSWQLRGSSWIAIVTVFLDMTLLALQRAAMENFALS